MNWQTSWMLCLKKHSRKNPTDNYITNPGGDCFGSSRHLVVLAYQLRDYDLLLNSFLFKLFPARFPVIARIILQFGKRIILQFGKKDSCTFSIGLL